MVTSIQAFAGVGTQGTGLGNLANASDVLSVQGAAIFGSSGFGSVFTDLLLLMVLSSAAASTQTTILPTARTTLSMAAYKALPDSFAKTHPRYMTPTVSTIAMGGISIVLYAAMNYGAEYFAGYIVEKSLSVDNLFVFVIIMTTFAVPREHQLRRVSMVWLKKARALRTHDEADAFLRGRGLLPAP